MMKLFLHGFLIVWLSLAPMAQAVVGSSLDEPLLENQLLSGAKEIQAYCHSSLYLDPEWPFQEVTELYEHRQNCLFASSYKSFVNEEGKAAEAMLNRQPVQSRYKFAKVTADLSQCDLTAENVFSNTNNPEIQNEILAAQTVSGKVDLKSVLNAQNGPDFCSTKGDNAGKDYSLCNLSLAVHHELCGFQEYAAIKLRNEIFIKDCEGDRLTGNLVDCVDRSQALLNENLVSAEEMKETRLKSYHTRTSDTYLHFWLVLWQEQLENVYRGLDLIRIALEKWASKFHDATSQKAGSLPSK